MQVATFYVGRNVQGKPTYDHSQIVGKAKELFPAFTAWDGAGYWHGDREGTTVIQVMQEGLSAETVKAHAHNLELEFHQEKVLATLAEVAAL